MASTWLDFWQIELADGTVLPRRGTIKLGAEFTATDNESNGSTDLDFVPNIDLSVDDLTVKSLTVGKSDTPGRINLKTNESAITEALFVSEIQQTPDVGTSHYDHLLNLGGFNDDGEALIDAQRLGLRFVMEYEPSDRGMQRTVTGATNATPIVVTVAESVAALTEGDTVYIEGVLGNTAANGFFKAKNVNVGAKTFELYRRTVGGADVAVAGTGAWTSGGKVVDRLCAEGYFACRAPGAVDAIRPISMLFNGDGDYKFQLGFRGAATFYDSTGVHTLLQLQDGTGALVAQLGETGTSVSFHSVEKIDIQAGAASSVKTVGGGPLTLSGFGGIHFQSGGVERFDVGVTDPNAVTLAAGVGITGAAGAGAITLGSMTGNTTMPTGNWSWTGASGKPFTVAGTGAASAISITGGDALTLTGAASSTWSLSSGTLTVQAPTLQLATAFGTIQLRNTNGNGGLNFVQESGTLWRIDGTNVTDLKWSFSKFGWFGTTPVAQQTSGANLTNNVTVGGTADQIDNWTDLATYSTDAAAIRNAVYQLARKLKQVNDGMRAYGLLS